jgi:hypothetical protein
MKTMNMKTNRNLNTITKTILGLPMAALLLTSALAGPAAAGTLVPIKAANKVLKTSLFWTHLKMGFFF